MSAPRDSLRKGWCPGALRPMRTGDGLLVRVRPRGATLSLNNAALIAACAQRYGNGHLEVTSRANLQIRGVTDASLAQLIDELTQAKLLDADAAGESVRNVVVSPLAGLDPAGLFDIRPTVAALEDRLVADEGMRRLPAKFGFVVDDGGAFALTGVAADVRFTAMGADRYILGLADAAPLGTCTQAQVPVLAAAVARVFLARRGPDEKMTDVVRRIGATALTGAVHANGGQSDAVTTLPPDRCAPKPADLIGVRTLGAHTVLGIALGFGALLASDLTTLAAACSAAGAGDLRITPWRTMMVTGLTPAAAVALVAALAETALILDAADPRLHVAACSGAPACGNATTPVRADAATLAPLLAAGAGRGVVLHVSGCGKGCARAAPTRFTLVADAGLYGLVFDGNAGSRPWATGLTLAAAAKAITAEQNRAEREGRG